VQRLARHRPLHSAGTDVITGGNLAVADRYRRGALRSARASAAGQPQTPSLYSGLFLARLLLTFEGCRTTLAKLVDAIESPNQSVSSHHDALLAG
jgi:hypothetical protein